MGFGAAPAIRNVPEVTLQHSPRAELAYQMLIFRTFDSDVIKVFKREPMHHR